LPDARWYLPALLLMPVLMSLEYGGMRLAGVPVPAVELPTALLPLFPFIPLFVLSAIGEEVGWQGFAADPLLARWPALAAALILGAIWAVWHTIPYLQTTDSLVWVFWQSVATVGLRVLIVWLYLNTGRSLFAVVLIGLTVVVVCLWGAGTLARR
jgi:membrane protease YdiL (CAAX protease family)